MWDGTRWVVDKGNRIEAMAKQVIMSLYREAQGTIDRVAKLIEQHGLGSEETQKSQAKEVDTATARLKWTLKSESAERLSGMLKHAKSERGISVTPEQLDAIPWLLNCRNGVLNLKTAQALSLTTPHIPPLPGRRGDPLSCDTWCPHDGMCLQIKLFKSV